jgi:hypothetical protein
MHERNNFNFGIQGGQGSACRLDFRHADRIRAIEDLPLKIGEVDLVRVGQGEFADAARGEVERCRAAQAAGADDERMRGAQPLLPLDPDFVEKDVAAVAEELLVVQAARTGGKAGAKVSSFSRPAWSARPRAPGP